MTRKNKWWLILVYCLAGVLLVSTIACCIIKVNYKPEIENPFVINIQEQNYAKYISAVQNAENENDEVLEKRYNEIMEKFDKAFEETVLTSVFSGRASTASRIIESSKSKPENSFTGFKVKFTYLEEKTIMLNNKPYNPPTNSAQTIQYKEIVFDVTKTEGMAKHYIYYVTIDEEDTTKYVYFEQSVMCDFGDLYELLAGY